MTKIATTHEIPETTILDPPLAEIVLEVECGCKAGVWEVVVAAVTTGADVVTPSAELATHPPGGQDCDCDCAGGSTPEAVAVMAGQPGGQGGGQPPVGQATGRAHEEEPAAQEGRRVHTAGHESVADADADAAVGVVVGVVGDVVVVAVAAAAAAAVVVTRPWAGPVQGKSGGQLTGQFSGHCGGQPPGGHVGLVQGGPSGQMGVQNCGQEACMCGGGSITGW